MTGSFKERGAANLLLQLDAAERRRGVVAASAGNHGLAVAFHAARLGIAAIDRHAGLGAAHQGRAAPAATAPRSSCTATNYDEAYARAARDRGRARAVFVHPVRRRRASSPARARSASSCSSRCDDLDAVRGPGGRRRADRAASRWRSRRRRPAVRVIGVQAEEMPAMQAALAGASARRRPSGADHRRRHRRAPGRRASPSISRGVRRRGGDGRRGGDRQRDPAPARDREDGGRGRGRRRRSPRSLNRRVGLAGQDAWRWCSPAATSTSPCSRASSSAAWSRTAASCGSACVLHDRPGALARLTALIAEERVNILQIEHDRAFSRAGHRRQRGRADARDLRARADRRPQDSPRVGRLRRRGARRLAPRPSVPISRRR